MSKPQIRHLAIMARDTEELAAIVRDHRRALEPVGAGTKRAIGHAMDADLLDLSTLARPHANLHFAGEATTQFFPGTVHGAYRSGRRAANEILARL